MSHYDYLIVGSGWFGAVFARQMTDAGRRCLVIDKRKHIGGNCFTEKVEGIHVHRYGPHIFHTNSARIWNYVNRFATFLPYVHRGRVRAGERLFSFPINLQTLEQVWGIGSADEAQRKLEQVRVPIANPRNLEEWALSQVGEELYRLFIHGYTTKQWQRDPKELPASILKRIPIRTDRNDQYFDDQFQGIPQGGYTAIFEKLLEGSDVLPGVDYFEHKRDLRRAAQRIVYTGPIDRLFDFRYGKLEYRTLHFETRSLPMRDFQGAAIVNYADRDTPFTRIVEHKHFELGHRSENTVVTWEFPRAWSQGAEPYYPINDDRNQALYVRYRALAQRTPRLILGGRLACYRYYDMHQVIGSALEAAKCELAVAEQLMAV